MCLTSTGPKRTFCSFYAAYISHLYLLILPGTRKGITLLIAHKSNANKVSIESMKSIVNLYTRDCAKYLRPHTESIIVDEME